MNRHAAKRKPAASAKWERVAIPTADAVDTSWTGTLSRDCEAITGELRDHFGWRLALTATSDGPRKLHLTATLAREGDALPPWDDDCHREDMGVQGYRVLWVGTIDRGEGGWTGTMQDTDGWVLHLTGTSDAPGRITLAGEVRDTPAKFTNPKT